MPDVWLGILNRFVEKYLNVKGGPTVVDFNHQVHLEIPVLIGVEERYHQGWSRFGMALVVTGGAGQNAGMQLRNPLGSNAIGVVERLGYRSSAAGNIGFAVSFQGGPAGIADLTTIQTPANIDGRSTTGATLVLSTSTAAVSFVRNLQIASVTNGAEGTYIQTENQEITLIPGSAIMIVDNTAADTAAFQFLWRERPLETSELT